MSFFQALQYPRFHQPPRIHTRIRIHFLRCHLNLRLARMERNQNPSRYRLLQPSLVAVALLQNPTTPGLQSYTLPVHTSSKLPRLAEYLQIPWMPESHSSLENANHILARSMQIAMPRHVDRL